MMTRDFSTDETTVVATYSNRQNAEIARTQLEKQEISSFVVADDVHPPLQLTEGVELRVLDREVEQAHKILTIDGDTAVKTDSREMPSETDEAEKTGGLMFSDGGFVQATAWIYVAAFLLMVTVIIMGLLISSWGF
jgi:hypothetical protein